MPDVLVTGATGLIGSRVVDALRQDHRVFALARRPIAPAPNLVPVVHDLRSPSLPPELRAVDTVVHLAQSRHFREFPEHATDIFEVNVASTARLLDWSWRAGVRRFVFASSGGIYGHGDTAFSEEDALHPAGSLGYYLASKHSTELLVESYHDEFTVVVLRFFFVYGRGQRETMLVPRLVRSVRDGRPIALQGHDGLRLNPIHIDDAVRAVQATLTLGESHKVNVAGPDVLSLREIGEIIGRHVGRQPAFSVDTASAPRHLVGDITKMSKVLAPPRLSFCQGVQDLYP